MRGINAGHYSYHLENGLVAFDARNFAGAKRQFGAAIWYAQAGFLGPEMEAAAVYDCGLAVGQLGDLDKAEEFLKRAMELDEKYEGKNGPHATSRLLELARLYQAQGKYGLAAKYYEKGFDLVNVHGGPVATKDPINVAFCLEDYAFVLKQIGDHAKSEVIGARARQLRAENPGAEPKVRIHYYPGDPIHP